MSYDFTVQTVVPETEGVPSDILELCNLAYGQNLKALWAGLGPTIHAVGKLDERLVSHAMWVRHDLEPEGCGILATAYVEGVGTHPELRGRGYATHVLSYLVERLPDYIELAALCPAEPGLYQKSGWEFWRGPLRVKMPDGKVELTPDERIMVMALPDTPPLDLDQPITAPWRPGEVW